VAVVEDLQPDRVDAAVNKAAQKTNIAIDTGGEEVLCVRRVRLA